MCMVKYVKIYIYIYIHIDTCEYRHRRYMIYDMFVLLEASLHEADATLKETHASASTEVGSMEAESNGDMAPQGTLRELKPWGFYVVNPG